MGKTASPRRAVILSRSLTAPSYRRSGVGRRIARPFEAPNLTRIPLAIIDQHVDAVRAIVREHGRADISAITAALTSKLRIVTDEFLVKENRHRPDVLKAIQSPALVPGESF